MLRNWVIGFYIIEYEQHGEDRAVYGQRLYKEIAAKLKKGGVTSIRERHLYLCKDFYKAYSHILQTASAKLYLTDLQNVTILRTMSAKSITTENATGQPIVDSAKTAPDLLLNRLSFSHFIELLKSDTLLKRQSSAICKLFFWKWAVGFALKPDKDVLHLIIHIIALISYSIIGS